MYRNQSAVLLPTSYFGPVYYYTIINIFGQVYIEQHENFSKQTYRNRCNILAANGTLSLTIPIERGRTPGQKVTTVKIDNHTPWQRNHWRSIKSAYNNSPFFDFYADDLAPFFFKRYVYLFDLNHQIMQAILKALDIEKSIVFTDSFEAANTTVFNFRDLISPKKHLYEINDEFLPKPYTQVFEEKYGFVPGLSILDLLFCTGPMATEYLKID